MLISSASAAGKSFEVLACEVLTRWTSERDLSVTPDDTEAARRYLEELHIKTVSTVDGRFLLARTGQVVDRVELVLLCVRQLVARRPKSAPW